VAAAALLVLVAMPAGTSPASAPGVKPWVPPQADSLLRWATDAKASFRMNQGDSVGGSNFRAYTQVGLMGRKLLRSLGRSGLMQAHAVEAVIDSLGLDTEITLDPASPTFCLLMVRNPYRITANSVGFLYWYREDDLRIQGLMFRGGMDARMRVWWTGEQTHPYEWAILDHGRGENRRPFLKLLRLSPEGAYWDLFQFDEEGPDLGDKGEAAFVDLDGDDRPEVVSWVQVPNDSMFEECSGCQGLISERTFVERAEGYDLNDTRIIPSPYATFSLFIRLLTANDRRGASRLVRDPAQVDEALAAGWGSVRAAKSWRLEGGESGRWPRWIELRFRGPKGRQGYVVHFEQREGRWIIRDWRIERAAASATPKTGATSAPPKRPAPAPSTGQGTSTKP